MEVLSPAGVVALPGCVGCVAGVAAGVSPPTDVVPGAGWGAGVADGAEVVPGAGWVVWVVGVVVDGALVGVVLDGVDCAQTAVVSANASPASVIAFELIQLALMT